MTDPVRGQAREGVHLGKLISTAELAAAWGVSPGRIRQLRQWGRLPGAVMVAGRWAFPASLAKKKEELTDQKYSQKPDK